MGLEVCRAGEEDPGESASGAGEDGYCEREEHGRNKGLLPAVVGELLGSCPVFVTGWEMGSAFPVRTGAHWRPLTCSN